LLLRGSNQGNQERSMKQARYFIAIVLAVLGYPRWDSTGQ
jgi:hypothetical protein